MPVTKELFGFLERPRNHMNCDEFSDSASRCGAGVERGIDGAHIASN
jgi:hypothetical protein